MVFKIKEINTSDFARVTDLNNEIKPNLAWFYADGINLLTGTNYDLGSTQNYNGKMFVPRSLFILLTQGPGIAITAGVITLEYQNGLLWIPIGSKDLTGLTAVGDYVSVLMGSNGLGKAVPPNTKLRLSITGKAKGITGPITAKAYLAGIYF